YSCSSSCSCSGSYQAQPIQPLDGGHNRRQEGEDFGELNRAAPAEPPLNGLKAGSPGAARLSSPKSSPYPSPGEETSHEAHLRKTGGRQSSRNEADTQTRSS